MFRITNRCVCFFVVFASISVVVMSAETVILPSDVISGLKAPEFKTREQAEVKLLAWGRLHLEASKDILWRQLEVADDPEVRERCMHVLRTLVIDDYLKEGEGYLGINMREGVQNVPNDKRPRGVVFVSQVMPDSAADLAGIKVNDAIVGLDGTIWYGGNPRDDFSQMIRAKKPVSKVSLKILRDGKVFELEAVLGRRPSRLNSLMFDGPETDLQALEVAEKDAYFRRWLNLRKAQN